MTFLDVDEYNDLKIITAKKLEINLWNQEFSVFADGTRIFKCNTRREANAFLLYIYENGKTERANNFLTNFRKMME